MKNCLPVLTSTQSSSPRPIIFMSRSRAPPSPPASTSISKSPPSTAGQRKRELAAAAARSGHLLQCGMQQRSGAHYQRVKEEFFAAGRLGDVVQVRAVWHNFPWQSRNIPDAPQPPGLDWQRFPAPRRACRTKPSATAPGATSTTTATACSPTSSPTGSTSRNG